MTPKEELQPGINPKLTIVPYDEPKEGEFHFIVDATKPKVDPSVRNYSAIQIHDSKCWPKNSYLDIVPLGNAVGIRWIKKGRPRRRWWRRAASS